jgi:DNA mismatch repair protein MutS2
MIRFDTNSLEILEYHKIVSIVQGLCLTPYGTANVERMLPTTDIEVIRRRLDEIEEMKQIILFGTALPLYRLDETSDLIYHARTEGAIIEPKKLLLIKEQIEVALELHDYARDEREKFPLVAEYLADLHPFPDIKKAIARAIDYNGDILDGASGKLKNIRSDIGRLRQSIINRLEQILAGRKKSPGWQDDTVTQRDGRYVIPVVTGQHRADSGIIHDRSQSGATMYVEPNEVVEANNRLGLLYQEERLEIDRILKELTAMIGQNAEKLLSNLELIGILDSIHAAAALALKIGAQKPLVVSNNEVDLIKARHPLLLYYTENKEDVVSNDFSLNESRRVMIITGPNTGGKTVALKTVGLLALMALSGLHIPADDRSRVGVFNNVFADIGDEQSIELSLSTFSSHVRKIIHAVRQADKNSLVLFDEIGAGTDPKEGAALAEAIILRLLEIGCKTIVTTHYSQLKTLPMENPEIENASFEFDRESLQPTFRLHTGIPGASYAVEIAERLGMPKKITSRAAGLVGQSERSLTALIESLEKELGILREDKAELEERLSRASQLESDYKSRSKEFKEEVHEKKQRKLEELENSLKKARRQIEQIVKELRESQASEKTVKKAHKFLKETDAKIARLKQKHDPEPKKKKKLPIQPGDTVYINSFRKEGEFIEKVGNNKAKIRVGNIMTTVAIEDIKPLPAPAGAVDMISPVNMGDIDIPDPEIHLRGMTVEEATERLDKYLDKAILTGISQVYVIHGLGTGTLRRALGEYLRNHPAVASIRLGNWNEGGAGVTIVRLK